LGDFLKKIPQTPLKLLFFPQLSAVNFCCFKGFVFDFKLISCYVMYRVFYFILQKMEGREGCREEEYVSGEKGRNRGWGKR
jgi:hypothetical protein